MDLKMLKQTPSWEWPQGTGTMLLRILRDARGDASDRLLAAELAGDFVVINDELADALLAILRRSEEREELRGEAAISLGTALEHGDTMGFDHAEDILITEDTFRRIKDSLRTLYMDADVPENVRRRILEASVRAPQDWHRHVLRAACSEDDEAWRLTAVFCMRFIRGFDEQILEALESTKSDIHYDAVCAAGNWELDEAWPHVAALVSSEETDKLLLLAAIDAVASIRPHEAPIVLADLIGSEDEDIADAVSEALAMAEGQAALEDFDEEDEDGFLH
jgi:hypothetical protein